MKKTEIKELIKCNISDKNLCVVNFRYDYNWFGFPLASSDKLFLGLVEDDFITDGYTIRRFVDATKARVKSDKCYEILQKEGIISNIQNPNIDVTNWETVFKSLEQRGKNVIVEHESLDEDDGEFIIGRIVGVYKKFVYIHHFDVDGIWMDEPYKVLYSEITSVTFGSRYVDIFSRYLDVPSQ